jgi:hypothetical protein
MVKTRRGGSLLKGNSFFLNAKTLPESEIKNSKKK